MQPRPKRIQRQRTKGWKMPEGAVYVGRPTKWGNPYRHDDPVVAAQAYRDVITDPDAATEEPPVPGLRCAGLAMDHHRVAEIRVEAARDLRGKDLVCWCPTDRPCHADVLLEVANGWEPGSVGPIATAGEKTPLWAKCRACAHCWPIAYLPMSMATFGRIAKKGFACPACGDDQPVVAKQKNGELKEEVA
ncbi:DUF4326 domain-containing protein [Nisaea sediminum]|uniref:DUF4326 domain-containing protein n=1 Tax=Nisaea sediminum TaxID=2775867 RepID=UPI001865D299|nr:DUF4326 domain-containing protein [Nisaea sediminum]